MLERTYTIPLRKEWMKTPKYKRAKKAVIALRQFLSRHMKSDVENVRLGKHLNEFVWQRGIRSPPSKIKVNVVKDDKGFVKAELFGAPKEEIKQETVEKKTETKVEAKPATVEPKQELKIEKKEEAKAEEKLSEAKVEQKKESKEEKPKAKRGRPKKKDESAEEKK